MSATIDLHEDATIFMSIPYDKGWKIYVDGQKVKYRELADTFIGVDIPKGKHNIRMKFYPRGLFIGCCITFISTIFVFMYIKKLSN